MGSFSLKGAGWESRVRLEEYDGEKVIAWSYFRGHKIIYTVKTEWIYEDSGQPTDEQRPCAKCGRKPLPGGEDACLGHIEGVKSACCGHGVTEPLLMYDEIEGTQDV